MTQDLQVQCTCGSLQGVAKDLAPAVVNRCICYCDDCQLFAHFLDRTDDVLHNHGGTEVYQMSPRHFQLTQGQEHLACVRLRPKGLYRWYASCCNTPLANSLTGGVAFIGLIHPSLQGADDATVGPIRMRVHGRFARGIAAGAHPKAPITGVLKVIGRLLKGRLKGEHKRHCLFDSDTGRAVVQPQVLETDQLNQLIQARSAWMATGPLTPGA